MAESLGEFTHCTEPRCGEPATGVIRSRGDNFIYTAKCDRHGNEEAAFGRCWFDRWGAVGPVAGPIAEYGVRYTRIAPVVGRFPGSGPNPTPERKTDDGAT